jgi:hypothetical protein
LPDKTDLSVLRWLRLHPRATSKTAIATFRPEQDINADNLPATPVILDSVECISYASFAGTLFTNYFNTIMINSNIKVIFR